MGQIASDYFKKYGSAYIAENPFTVEELIRMGSHDIQEEYAGLMDSEESYIPAELLASLLRDRAFFTNLLALRDSGRIIALENKAKVAQKSFKEPKPKRVTIRNI